MPEDFNRCVENNGKVYTETGPNKKYGLKSGQYIHFCVLNGKSYRGEVKTKEKMSTSKIRRDLRKK